MKSGHFRRWWADHKVLGRTFGQNASATTPLESTRPLGLATGASSGIGYELARLFARNGYDLVATGRSDTIHQAAADFEKDGAQVIPVQADLVQRDGFDAVWQATQATGRPLAAAVLNAGRSIGGALRKRPLAYLL